MNMYCDACKKDIDKSEWQVINFEEIRNLK
jgi:hypothetical protein